MSQKTGPHRLSKMYIFEKILGGSQIPHKVTIIITQLIVIDIAPLTVLFCNCPLADL